MFRRHPFEASRASRPVDDWLREQLGDGQERKAGDLMQEIDALFHLKERAVLRAAHRLGVTRRFDGSKTARGWYWRLESATSL